MRTADEVAEARRALGVPPDTFAIGTVTRLMPSKGNEYLVEAAGASSTRLPSARFYIVGEGELQPALEAQAAALGLGDRLVFSRVSARCRGGAVGVRPAGLSVALGGHAAHRARSAGDGEGDCLDRCRRPAGRADRRPRRAHGAATRCGGARRRDRAAGGRPGERARLGANARATGAQYDIDLFVRKMERLYVLLHETSRATRRKGVLQRGSRAF